MKSNQNPSYYSLNDYLKSTFGCKVYKLALDGGMSCPNRDGTLGTGGCIFCSQGGSGEFAAPSAISVSDQIALAKSRILKKMGKQEGKFIAYFQSYTNTYAPVAYLDQLFSQAISEPDIAALSIATRPDCLPEPTITLLKQFNQKKPVWVELGLQSIHASTARLIRRGYELSCFEEAFRRLKESGLSVIVHVILGLPGESRRDMLETIRYLGNLGRPQFHIDGIKLQLLHVLKGTDLDIMYQKQPFPLFTMEEYVDFVIDCIALLPPDLVIHRLTGDGPKALLTAPLWSTNKRLVLNTMTRRFRERGITQGCWLTSPSPEIAAPSDSSVIF